MEAIQWWFVCEPFMPRKVDVYCLWHSHFYFLYFWFNIQLFKQQFHGQFLRYSPIAMHLNRLLNKFQFGYKQCFKCCFRYPKWLWLIANEKKRSKRRKAELQLLRVIKSYFHCCGCFNIFKILTIIVFSYAWYSWTSSAVKFKFKKNPKEKWSFFWMVQMHLKIVFHLFFPFSQNLFWNFIHHHHHELILISNNLF